MVKTIKFINELSIESLETGLILINNCEGERQTISNSDIALLFAVDNNVPTVYLSFEHREDIIARELLKKQLARYTNNIAALSSLSQEEMDRVEDGVIRLSKAPLYIVNHPNPSIDSIHTIAKKVISEKRPGLFVIDGIHLLEEKNPIQLLEAMATDLNVTLIAGRTK